MYALSVPHGLLQAGGRLIGLIIVFGDSKGNLTAELKGIISAAYSLGAILSLPVVPFVNKRLGRRWSIAIGSIIMIIGAIIQGFAQNGQSTRHHAPNAGYRCDWIVP